MSTNYYWKELPEWFKENAEHPTMNNDNIFIHIGKRSASGGYCYTCGATRHRYGTDEVHGKYNANPRYIFGKEQNINAWEKECEEYYHKKCPCCGKEFTKSTTSFRWTLMIHKKLIEEIANSKSEREREQKIIVDEYGKEFTAQEFLDATHSPIEFQDACIFS